ncbi:hypothetical protein E6O75_ATG03865 [Venturia nashicola]|uniref:Uncharacterized protein n=1 Tax=Venturia nashicola TaxID=86259 RepID=A0A4Z1PSE4_9PEZI|nr:hypothetical protein E6O75_ATG03865 [Venturia nashicola]
MHATLVLFLGAASTLAFPHPDYNSIFPAPATAHRDPIPSLLEIAGASRTSVAYSGSKSSFGAGGYTAGNVGSPSTYGSGGRAAGISEHIEHTGPVETLRPVVHWNVDTKPAQNIIPVAIGNGCPPKKLTPVHPKKAHIFGTMTYFYKSSAVNLDYADHASGSWTVGMILSTHTTDCGGEVGKGYLSYAVALLVKSKIIHSGEVEWGVYEPARDGNGGFGGFGSPSGPGKASDGTVSGSSSVFTTSTATSTSPFGSPSSSGSLSSSGTGPASGSIASSGSASSSVSSSTASSIPSASNLLPGTNSTSASNGTLASKSTLPQNLESFGPNATVCQGPKDTKYGLPTACLGNLFDLELDTRLGFQGQSTEFEAWLDTFAPGNDDGNLEEPSFERRSTKIARRLSKRGWLSGAINWVAQKTTQAVAFVQEVKQKIGDATSIPGDFTTNMAFQVPKAAAPAEGKVIESPWGNSILLKAFGTQGTPEQLSPSRDTSMCSVSIVEPRAVHSLPERLLPRQ